MPNGVDVDVGVAVVAAVTKSKVSSVSLRSSYLAFELVSLPLAWSIVGLLEFRMTDIRGDTSLASTFEWLLSGTLDELLKEVEGKVESGFSISGGGALNDLLPPENLKLPKFGQYELLDFGDLAQLCLAAWSLVAGGGR